MHECVLGGDEEAVSAIGRLLTWMATIVWVGVCARVRIAVSCASMYALYSHAYSCHTKHVNA